MMRFLADENFSNRILRGLRREQAEVDIVRVQDTEIFGADDPTVLAWAAAEERILLTHDVRTMPKYAYERVRAGQPMPGVIAVHLDAPIGAVIEDLLVVIGASEPAEYEGQVVYLPL
jgi:predicted nuclease of predicted toxin-antitoxin system